MNEGTIALTAMTLLLLLIFAGLLVWGLRTGQFRNVEEAKYQVFRNYPSATDRDDTQGKEQNAGGGEKNGEQC